ncbi:hypothetical protein N7G274_010249 [Stereocaulon virgatum]|uniref:Transcription factor TFIIIB component B'' Myb domain-containing protein n=1 Tax=Stereocaulon virgatum TaxID=373712 RepID=A0ABR3ZWR0_9LECA
MSALGSSVINKSGKKFAPKAPARRPAAPTSTQTSARPSVDRQVQSQTPQPQSVAQRFAASPTPSTSLPTPTSTQHRVPRIQTIPPQQDETAVIPILSPSTTLPRRVSPVPVIPQKRPSEPRQSPCQPPPVTQPTGQDQASGATGSIVAPNDPNQLLSDIRSTPRPPPSATKEALVSATIGLPTPSGTQTTQDDAQAPAAKRRRTAKSQTRSPAAHRTSSEGDANVPLPSTETSEVVAEASSTAKTRIVSTRPTQEKKTRLTAQKKRKKQIGDVAGEVVEEANQGPSAKTKRPSKTTKRKEVDRSQTDATETSVAAVGESSGAADQNAAPAKAKRRYTKRNSKHSLVDAAAEIVDDVVQGSVKDPMKRGRRSRRAVTPDGAEEIVISTSEVTMSDLCKDRRTGRKSDFDKQIEEYERADFVRKKQKQLQEVLGQTESSRATPDDSASARLDRQTREESVAQNVPRTYIVDGQIRIDEDSLQIDRHAAAAVERAHNQLEAVDETNLTRKVNSATWLKRDKSGGWNALLTERFYDGLRMFGTDFEMISKMFPGRTRHKIKLKFVKEEKVNYDKIRATLLGEPLPVDLPEFEKMAGTEFDDPEELDKDIEEDRQKIEEQIAATKQAIDDAKREREAQIAAERAAAIGEESSAKENRERKAKRKKGEKGEKRKKSGSRMEQHAKRKGKGSGNSVGRELGEAVGVENET